MSAMRLIGRGWQFPVLFRSPLAGPEMEEEEALIKQSLHLLLGTRVGERLQHPEFGCGLADYLFSAIDEAVLADLREEIAKAIEQQEHRISLDSINFNTELIYQGQLNIEIGYTVNQTNNADNLVYPFYLAES